MFTFVSRRHITGFVAAVCVAAACNGEPTDPSLAIGDVAVDPGTVEIGVLAGALTTDTQRIHIGGDEAAGVEWVAATSKPWLTVEPSSGTAPAEVDLLIQADRFEAGVYEGAVRFGFSRSGFGPVFVVSVPVRLVSGDFTVDRDGLHFSAVRGEPGPSPQTLAVEFSRDVPIRWRVRTNAPWIMLEDTAGTTPSEVSIGIAPGRFVGEVTDTVVIEVPGMDAMRSVPVHLRRTSPPARGLVFVRHYDIVLTEPDGSGARVLTPEGERDRQAVWSADGERLMVVRRVDPPPDTYTPGQDYYHLFIVRPDGGPAERVIDDGSLLNLRPAWSPNGRRVAFDRVIYKTDSGVFVMNPDGTDLHKVSDGKTRGPAWSPFGDRLVVHCTEVDDAGDGEVIAERLCTMAPDGSAVQELSFTAGYRLSRAAWSPDGRTIIAKGRHPGSNDWEIFAVDLGEEIVRQLTDAPGVDASPDWSPDGEKIVFLTDREHTGEYPSNTCIYVMDADGSDQRRLADHCGHGVRIDWPRWRP